MFNKIKENISKIFMTVLLSFLILSFAIWGIGDILRSKYDDSVAEVGSSKISKRELDEQTNAQLSRMQAAFGGKEVPAEIKDAIQSQVLKQLIYSRLMQIEVKNLGLIFDNKDFAKEILDNQYMQKDGKFDKDKFSQYLRSQGINEEDFFNQQNNLSGKMAVENVVTLFPAVSDVQVRKFNEGENQRRTIEYIKIPKDFITTTDNPNDSDLLSFYENRKKEFEAQEYRNLTFITISEKDVKDETGTKSTDDLIYELTNQIIDKISGGAGLDEIAKELNLNLAKLSNVDVSGKKSDGTIDSTTPTNQKFLEMAFKTAEGDISDLIEDKESKKYYLLKVDGITPPRERALDEVKALVTEAWIKQNKLDKLKKFTDEAAAKVESIGIDKFAVQNNLQVIKVEDIQQKDEKSKLPAGFISATFEKSLGKVTAPFVSEDGSYYIGKVSGINSALETEENLFSIRTQLEDQVSSDMMEQYINYLSTKYSISVK
jgi:peptidyl-prolyl cis-trans isomerase D